MSDQSLSKKDRTEHDDSVVNETVSFSLVTSSNDRLVLRLVELLKSTVGIEQFSLWFDGDDSVVVTNETITILGASKFALKRLQTTFDRDIRMVVDRVAGPQYSVRYENRNAFALPNQNVNEKTAGQTSEESPARGSDGAESKQPEVGRLGGDAATVEPSATRSVQPEPPAKATTGLSSFWFGDENRLAKASVDHVFEHLGQFSPLLVYGPCGVGKTHLLTAVTNDVRRRLHRKRCVFLSAEQFTSNFLQSLRGSGLPMFRRKYRDLDLLAIDDIQFFEGKRATLNEFQYTIDNLIRLGKQVVVSSDRPPIELGGLGHDITARLTAGLVTPMKYAGFEGRVKIVTRMAKNRGFQFTPSVVRIVCEKISGDVRRLSGAINRLHTASISYGCTITESFAEEVLSDLFAETGSSTSMKRIEKVVCEFCGVETQEIRSSSRKKRVSTARMLAMYLSRQHTSSAFSEIGDYYGGRSHSTVIAAQKKVDLWLKGDQQISLPHAKYRAKEVVDRIKSQLKIG